MIGKKFQKKTLKNQATIDELENIEGIYIIKNNPV